MVGVILNGDTGRLSEDFSTRSLKGFGIDAVVGFGANGLFCAGAFVEVEEDVVAKGLGGAEVLCPPKGEPPKPDPLVCDDKTLGVVFKASNGDFWRAG